MSELTGSLLGAYDPQTAKLLDFASARPAFLDRGDTPREYLERCIGRLEYDEALQAFVHIDLEGARRAADSAGERYKDGRPLSPLDGMPLGMKDVIETGDMPTEFGSGIYKGFMPHMDAAPVYWLRKAGAVILGKTATTEFAADPPGPTRNPWDLSRSPGGSSSGSAAAVAARMVPAATGTQVRGSVLRPAAYCGIFAFKPSLGTINLQGVSPISRVINHLGILAGSLADSWITTRHLSQTGGGEPGRLPLDGPAELPGARKPKTLIQLETPGWPLTPESSRTAFEEYVERLRASDITVHNRRNNEMVDAYERALEDTVRISDTLRGWENRYPMYAYLDSHPDQLRNRTRKRLEDIPPATLEDYRTARADALALRDRHAALSEIGDALITLNSAGPAPDVTTTGNPIYGDACSVTGVPAVNLPLLAAEGLPLGVQVMGFYREDEILVAVGRWLAEAWLSKGKN